MHAMHAMHAIDAVTVITPPARRLSLGLA